MTHITLTGKDIPPLSSGYTPDSTPRECRWPNTLSDAEFKTLIERYQLNLSALTDLLALAVVAPDYQPITERPEYEDARQSA